LPGDGVSDIQAGDPDCPMTIRVLPSLPPIMVSVRELALTLLATTSDEKLTSQLRDLLGKLNSKEITLHIFAVRVGELIGKERFVGILNGMIKSPGQTSEGGIPTPSRMVHRYELGSSRQGPSLWQGNKLPNVEAAQQSDSRPQTGRDMSAATFDSVSSLHFDALAVSPG